MSNTRTALITPEEANDPETGLNPESVVTFKNHWDPDQRNLVVIRPPPEVEEFTLDIEEIIRAIAFVCNKKFTP